MCTHRLLRLRQYSHATDADSSAPAPDGAIPGQGRATLLSITPFCPQRQRCFRRMHSKQLAASSAPAAGRGRATLPSITPFCPQRQRCFRRRQSKQLTALGAARFLGRHCPMCTQRFLRLRQRKHAACEDWPTRRRVHVESASWLPSPGAWRRPPLGILFKACPIFLTKLYRRTKC